MINLTKFIFSIFASTFICSLLHAQSIGGTITDEKTREPLSYVHIGISGKGIGTISDEKGRFNLQLQESFFSDTLTFSIIGYNIFFTPISDLLVGNGNIKMTQSVIQLKEVIVEGQKSKELLRFGRTKPTKVTTGASGIESYGIGQEIGTTIKSDGGVYLIDAINFHHRWNTVDSILYRINIYSIKDQMPHNSILEKELFVMAYKRDKWVTKKIDDLILFDQDLFVSIELVRRWNNKGDNQLFYSHGDGLREWQSYIRPTSLAPWTSEFSIPLTLYLSVEKIE
ncbi:carboxypeptidase-like regulatory domain-containing protein [Anditalea andensis]|uniref:Carboxypeptidase-like regulatory domain-containing protein n=1 Tax=Anditalea andensis TaxID=1048983 RepID=A0A074LDH8_9BACT|nr:carboxypeptidase-like regulatory domain-containing protein [Anditalea andensis]KEO71847.1 hypothetical protein EL17_21055 [Anditalea andensis]